MIYLDYFFFFLGVNKDETGQPQSLQIDKNDSNQYLFWMKDMVVKSQYMIHNKVLYLDKNVTNPMEKKFLMSLGIDYKIDVETKAILSEVMVFKIWDILNLDTYPVDGNLSGGSVWEKSISDQSG